MNLSVDTQLALRRRLLADEFGGNFGDDFRASACSTFFTLLHNRATSGADTVR
jgi:hypothetical protein